MPDWPWRETRLQRRTRIAHLYRDALMDTDPAACHDLDQTLDHYGQHWLTGNKPPHNPDEPMTAGEIAAWEDTTINNICNLVTNRGIKPAGRRRGRKTYWLHDFETNPSTCINTLV